MRPRFFHPSGRKLRPLVTGRDTPPSPSASAPEGSDSKEPGHALDLVGLSFQSEYDRELGKLLRRRLGWLCLAFALWELLAVSGMLARTYLPPLFEQYTAQDTAPPELLEAPIVDAPPTLLTPNAAATTAVTEPDLDANLSPSERARARRDEQRHLLALDGRATARELGVALGSFLDGMKSSFTREPSARARPNPARAPAMTTSPPARRIDRVGSDPLRRIKQAPLADGPKAAQSQSLPPWVWLLSPPIVFGILAWVGLVKRPQLTSRRSALRAASKLILLLGATKLAFETGAMFIDRDAWVFPLFSICFWHFAACLFLPWSARESLRPVWPLFFAWIGIRVTLATVEGGWGPLIAQIAFSPILFAPGLLICHYRLRWHENEFKAGFAGDRFRVLRQELGHARKLQETLFPKPADDGCVAFDFVYRPAAQIGGDFVYHDVDETGRTTILLIDVVGHGIASALTVARVQGELERLLSEHPDDGAAMLLHRLNHYFRKLLAKHRLFATALAARLDPSTGELRWANAGHPPAIIRSSRTLRTLDSTTFLLGAVDDQAFGTVEQSIMMAEGESAIFYTDGLIEAASASGERFGMERLQSTLSRAHPGGRWAQALARLVFAHAAGEQQDDILIVELFFRGVRPRPTLDPRLNELQTASAPS